MKKEVASGFSSSTGRNPKGAGIVISAEQKLIV